MSKMILIVDDEADIRRSLAGILEDEGYQVVEASNGADALELVREEVPDLVLLDIWMPGLDGIQTLERIKNVVPDMTVVMMSGHGTIETAVRATKLGAFDFVEKPFSLDKMLITIANAFSIKELRKENEALRRASLEQHELVGASPVLVNLREQVQRVAQASTPVLVTGEGGAGKELVARSIHHYSVRRDKPFVAVNCAAIPGELLTIELLGHEKNAFAGASGQRRGKVDLADGGTLFLDEVHELPAKAQAELVRIIRESRFERVGGSKSLAVDVRIITATAACLMECVAAGRFREDLYQLLNVIPFCVPSLRDRREDIPYLVRHFAAYFHRHEGWEPKQFDESAMAVLQGYQWPGNARELKNVVERVLIMAAGPIITAEDLPSFLQEDTATSEQRTADGGGFHVARERFERDFIRQRLLACGWDLDAAAAELELERTSLHRKMLQYDLTPPDGI